MAKNRGAKQKQKQALQDLIRASITDEDIPSIRKEFIEGTDRSAALIATAVVEGALTSALTARMCAFDPPEEFYELFVGPQAPLGTLSARIKLGKALGLYGSQVLGWLDSIRKIRNVYAHAANSIPFSHPTIISELETLPPSEIHVQRSSILHDLDLSRMSAARARYLGVCFALTDLFNASAKLHGGKPIWYDIPNGNDLGRSPLPEKFEVLSLPVKRSQG